jgi:phosphate transport system permease protein
MTSLAEPAPRLDTVPKLDRQALAARRRYTDIASRVGMWLAVAIAMVPIVLVVFYVVINGGKMISWEFLTGNIPRQLANTGGGIGPAIVGTLIMTGFASLLAIPLGVLAAIYLNEYGKQRPLARSIRLMSDVMTGVPSIVMGLFIYTSVVLIWGLSGFAGGLALACLMLPVVIRSSEEMLRLVPDELRQASLALGARKWRTITTVVIPAAISGIVSGALLAIARAAGETAPILLVVGLTQRINWSLSGSNTALPVQIYKNATEPFEAATNRAWGAALTLVTIVLVTTLVGRLIANRFAIKER